MQKENRRDYILKRLSKMKNVRANWENIWRKIALRADPKYVGLTGADKSRAAGDFDTGHRRFDSTLLRVIPKWASIVSAITTPKTEKWHSLSTTEKYFNEKYADWLEKANETLFRRRYAVEAKFNTANRESLLLMGTYGGAAMSIMRPAQSDKGNFYKTWPLKEWYVDCNFQGDIDTFFREYTLTKRQFLQEFDLESLPKDSKKLINDAEFDKEFTVICAVYPNENWDKNSLLTQHKQWAVIYLLNESKEIIEEGGCEVCPVIYQRYDVIPDLADPYPYSPVMITLSDQTMLNKMGETIAEVADRTAKPMILGANEDIINPAKLKSGRYIKGAINAQGQPLIAAMQYPSQLPYTLQMLQDYRGLINEAYGIELFRALLDNPDITATAILQQAQMQGIVMGPIAERRESEFLGPMIQIELYQAFLDGELPFMPEELASAFLNKDTELKIEYESPIRRAQKSGELQGLIETIEMAMKLGSIDPNIPNLINAENVVKKFAQVKGVMFSDIFRSEEEAQALNQQSAALQAQTAALQAGKEQAIMAKDLAQADALEAAKNEVIG